MNLPRYTAMLAAGALIAANLALVNARAADPVEMHGFKQDVIASNDVELAPGHYAMRALKLVVAPGGELGLHSHNGPVYFCVTQGSLASTVQNDAAHTVLAGQCVFHSGASNYTLKNTTTQNVSGLTFEMVPPSTSAGGMQMRSAPGMMSIVPAH
jgi:hypothetical protein